MIFTKTMKIDALKYNWNHSIINITAVYTKKQLTIALLGNKQNESKCRHYNQQSRRILQIKVLHPHYFLSTVILQYGLYRKHWKPLVSSINHNHRDLINEHKTDNSSVSIIHYFLQSLSVLFSLSPYPPITWIC